MSKYTEKREEERKEAQQSIDAMKKAGTWDKLPKEVQDHYTKLTSTTTVIRRGSRFDNFFETGIEKTYTGETTTYDKICGCKFDDLTPYVKRSTLVAIHQDEWYINDGKSGFKVVADDEKQTVTVTISPLGQKPALAQGKKEPAKKEQAVA